MIKKIKFKKAGNKALEESWMAPYADQYAFIINDEYLLLDGEVHEFDYEYYKNIFTIIETWG